MPAGPKHSEERVVRLRKLSADLALTCRQVSRLAAEWDLGEERAEARLGHRTEDPSLVKFTKQRIDT